MEINLTWQQITAISLAILAVVAVLFLIRKRINDLEEKMVAKAFDIRRELDSMYDRQATTFAGDGAVYEECPKPIVRQPANPNVSSREPPRTDRHVTINHDEDDDYNF